MGVGGQGHAPAALPPGKISVTYCIEGWAGLRAGLKGAENLASTGIRLLDRPARSESLYLLRHSGPRMTWSVETGHGHLPYDYTLTSRNYLAI